MIEIAVTVHGRKARVPLHRWRERIDNEQIAMVMRCETVRAGRMYAFECFVLLTNREYWSVHDDDAAAIFLDRLNKTGENQSYVHWARELPFVVDMRKEP